MLSRVPARHPIHSLCALTQGAGVRRALRKPAEGGCPWKRAAGHPRLLLLLGVRHRLGGKDATGKTVGLGAESSTQQGLGNASKRDRKMGRGAKEWQGLADHWGALWRSHQGTALTPSPGRRSAASTPASSLRGMICSGFTSSTRSSACLVRADGEVIPALAWILGPETDCSPHSRKPTSLPA